MMKTYRSLSFSKRGHYIGYVCLFSVCGFLFVLWSDLFRLKYLKLAPSAPPFYIYRQKIMVNPLVVYPQPSRTSDFLAHL